VRRAREGGLEWALGRAALAAREVVVAGVLLAALGALVFAPHVRSGGFQTDDWSTAAVYRFAPAPRYENAARFQRSILGGRPLMARAQPLPHAVFGGRFGWHLALAVALGVLASLACFTVLRLAGLAPLYALGAAGLALVFPWSDATRLWPIGAMNLLGPLAAAGGLALALRGLGCRGARAIAWHGGALALYAVALGSYEAVAGIELFFGVLYVAGAGWRAAWPRWLADIAVVVPIVLWAQSVSSDVRPAPGTQSIRRDLGPFAGDALEVVVRALTPFGPLGALPAALALPAAGLWLARRRRGDRDSDGELRRWGVAAGLCAVATVAAWVPFVGSGLLPGFGGINNRGNMVAAFTLGALAVSLAGLGATAALGTRRPLLTGAVAALAIAVLGAGYAYRVRSDIIRWDRATTLQAEVLDVLGRTVPRPAPGSMLYVAGYPPMVDPGVSVFSVPWDLDGAVKLRYGDPTLRALPVAAGVVFECGPAGVVPRVSSLPDGLYGSGYGVTQGARYGGAVLVDAARGQATVVRDAAGCRRATARLPLAPLIGDGPFFGS